MVSKGKWVNPTRMLRATSAMWGSIGKSKPDVLNENEGAHYKSLLARAKGKGGKRSKLSR